MKSSSFIRYLIYALGEILLIVAGVLIAVNINNYNDKRRKEVQLGVILENISKDLDSDLLDLETIIADYEELGDDISAVLKGNYTQEYFDSITEDNFSDCTPCEAYHLRFESFAPKLDGYNQLMNFDLNQNSESEKLSRNILFFYKDIIKQNNLIEQILATTTLGNLEALEEYDWYLNFMKNRFDPKVYSYFQSDQGYKNKLATFETLLIGNHLAILKLYREQASELSEKIKEYK